MRRFAVSLIAVLTLVGCGTTTASQGVPVIPPSPDVPPAAINIPKIHAASTLIPLGLNPDHTMESPDVNHPEQAGWYAKGVLPGKIGPAVIVGHIDGAGPTGKAGYPGVFAHLRDLTIGDEVDVTEANNVVLTFHVYRMIQVSKDSFPTMDVYRNTRGPELRLITCVGKFVGGATGYADNEIVFAR